MIESILNHPGVDVAIFVCCAGLVWLVFGRKGTIEEEPAEPLELEFMITEEPVTDDQPFQSFETWFRQQTYAAKLPFRYQHVPYLMLAVSAIAAAAMLVLSENPFAAVMTGVMTLAVLLAALMGIAKYQTRQFRKQLPLALDIMARAVRSGDGLREAVCLLSETMQEPAKTEFVRVRNQLDMGLSLRATMNSFAKRVGSLDAKLFATTLSVHRDTGGELSGTLERMASVIRSRFEYDRHMQATTGMGRMSVMIVVALAWLIFGYMAIMKPEYAADLWESPTGNQMLMAALIFEVVGLAWVFGLMKSDY